MATPFKIDGDHGEDEETKVPSAEAPAAPGTPAVSQPSVPAQPAAPTPAESTPSAEQKPEIAVETPPAAAQETPDAIPHAAAPASLTAKTQPETGEKKESKTLFWILVAILFVLILTVGGGTWYARQQGTTLIGLFGGEEEGEDMGEEEPPDGAEGEEAGNGQEVPEETVVGGSEFTGKYVTATLPEEWTIIEYFDGDGSDILVEGVTYEGLTGLKIFNPDDDTVFALAAVYGIGGIEACNDYYEFPDNSLSYYQEVATAANEIGITPNIIEVAADTYTEFTLFDLRVRRGGYTLYWDLNSDDPSSFDAACGMNAHIFIFDDLQFSADGNSLGNYQFDLSNSVNEADLLTLDSVLDSLEVAN
jgi:hypothetical protein